MKRHFYIHDESGSAFTSNEAPEIVRTDGCVEEVEREQYVAYCNHHGITIEPMVSDEEIFGDMF